jgi:23S rRNA (cytosine1962-C5)-methyltransferase
MIHLKKNIKRRILNGHPWIYNNEIDKIEKGIKKGDIVSIFYEKTFVGKGYYNPDSMIVVRLLTKKNEVINKDFFKTKILKALNYRKIFFSSLEAARIIFGESDGIPGLIVDKFANYLVIQINTYGINKYRNDILECLIEILSPSGIYEKDDEKNASKEGFDPVNGWVYKTGPELIDFKINHINFVAEINGQKTGFFLDQRINARQLINFSEDKKVIDLFCYSGNFGLHALKGGAKHVTFVDYSQRALELTEINLKNNNISKDRYDLINANAFDYLRMLDNSGTLYDLTLIDPPSLAKSRKSKISALNGYKELNLRAMKITKNEGFLCTSSCTQIIYPDDFEKMLFEAAENTNKRLKKIYTGIQSYDHPVDTSIFETNYLKNFIFFVENNFNY